MKHNFISNDGLDAIGAPLQSPPPGLEGFRYFSDSDILEIKMLGYDFASEHSFTFSSPERAWVNNFLADFPDEVFKLDFEIMHVEETYTVIQYNQTSS